MAGRLGDELGLNPHDKQQLLEELQLAKRGDVQRVRSAANSVVAITVRPADSADRDRVVATGMTRELRSRSVTAHVSRPVAIGGFYQLTLDESAIDLPPSFGRCDQITMLAEDRFEARFQFLQPIAMPGETRTRAD